MKLKRIFALLGAVLLSGLFILAIVLAAMGAPKNYLMAVIFSLVKICVPGGRILDPFCGAGTTVLAARLEGYEAVGIEVTDAYYKLGSDRVRFALEAHEKTE